VGETDTSIPRSDVADGLALTGFFVERHVLAPHNLKLPPARTRFVERFAQ